MLVGVAVSAFFALLPQTHANAQTVSGQELQIDPAIAKVINEYQECVAAATTKATGMKSAKLREKVFSGQMKGCERSRVAGLEIIALNDRQAVLRDEIASITDGLIANARSELGL